MPSPRRIAFAGLTVLAISLGIGRFLLTPLMPLMQADAGLGLVTGGWLASLNNAGYLAGALLCALGVIPARAPLRSALLIIALTTLGMGLGASPALWVALRIVAGITSAVLIVHGISWGMVRLRAAGRVDLEAVLFTGPGVGIAISGLLVALLRPHGVPSAWLWIGFGLLCAIFTGAVWRDLSAPEPPPPKDTSLQAVRDPAWPLIALYGLLGFSYVIPATFLPLIADTQLHLPRVREWFWPVYGVATTLTTLGLARWPERLGNYVALGVVSFAMLAGELLCAWWPSAIGLLLGTVLLGAVMMPMVVFVMREARRLAPRNPTRLIASLTVVFGIGQIAGPLVAAWLAERQHSFTAPLVLAAGAAGLAMLLVLPRLPRLQQTGDGVA
ncbi:YbfB/YjiJ family MFS transporter [Pendulispora rubella]|uniref:YbfB/YjiJ family MFS transporter n=1 Tax=Pendulispora rubella TaxID=2741070 RepID=A0ABZ2LIM6_9BACT